HKKEVTMSLIDANTNQNLKVKAIESGYSARNRLTSMGIIPGSELKVVKKSFFGPLVLLLLLISTVALGRGIAKKVIVEA
ncbi:MAG: FeoA domain-containing protein, partial [Sulfurovaceae bacterium]|nr:FeoA domain-containing protein [Sulfurovaceae bacterium]